MPSDPEQLTAPARAALDGYTETLRRAVAATLIKPRNPIPVDELTDRVLATLANPPVVDRRVRDLPAAARQTLAVLGLTRRPRWKIGHLLTTLSALGHTEGYAPIRTLLETGLLYPEREDRTQLHDLNDWLGRTGVLEATVFALPTVAERATDEAFDLPDLGEAVDAVTPGVSDGLEWPLRMAAVSQLVAEAPVRRTQANALFKRDLLRFQSHELLAAPPADHKATIPDAGVLALGLATATGLLTDRDGELTARSDGDPPFTSLFDAVTGLVGGLCEVEAWDPLLGYHLTDGGLSPFPSAAVCSLLLLANARGWVQPAAVADWLWANHPSWQGVLSKDAQKKRGAAWAEAFILGVLYPMRVVEAGDRDGPCVRLTDYGRHLFAGGPKPPEPPTFPHTLLAQPNGEVIAYRQGLTPPLIHKLTRFARWKSLGPACMLELTPEQTYRGLESGLTLAGILQTLNQHGTRPAPAAVVDLLQRWANKRERITVYPSATLVEFSTPAELDAAIARGIVAVRVTPRIGLCPDGGEPDFKHLRLVGNRDFDTRPSQCLRVGDDGVTLTVDAGQSDLLLEAEIGRVAEAVNGETANGRQFRLTPASLKSAVLSGWKLDTLDTWFIARTGEPLSPAGRLFVQAAALPASLVTKRTVLQLPNPATADGLYQWPTTRALVEDRLGPTAITVDDANLMRLIDLLGELGVRVETV